MRATHRCLSPRRAGPNRARTHAATIAVRASLCCSNCHALEPRGQVFYAPHGVSRQAASTQQNAAARAWRMSLGRSVARAQVAEAEAQRDVDGVDVAAA